MRACPPARWVVLGDAVVGGGLARADFPSVRDVAALDCIWGVAAESAHCSHCPQAAAVCAPVVAEAAPAVVVAPVEEAPPQPVVPSQRIVAAPPVKKATPPAPVSAKAAKAAKKAAKKTAKRAAAAEAALAAEQLPAAAADVVVDDGPVVAQFATAADALDCAPPALLWDAGEPAGSGGEGSTVLFYSACGACGAAPFGEAYRAWPCMHSLCARCLNAAAQCGDQRCPVCGGYFAHAVPVEWAGQ